MAGQPHIESMDAFRDSFLDLTRLSGPLFGSGPIFAGRAPGRLDVMGGVADYSGSLVLQAPIAAAVIVALRWRSDELVSVQSIGPQARHLTVSHVTLSLAEVVMLAHEARQTGDDTPIRLLLAAYRAQWAGYIVGCLYILVAQEIVSDVSGGLNIVVHSDIPFGAGLSSSAALEVATMRVLAASLGLELSGLRLAELCQLVEHRVVGAPCGIMDQVASALSKEGHLLALLCRPHHIEGWQRLPTGVAAIGIDSGVKHSTAAAHYANTRIATFMGRAIIRRALQQDIEPVPYYLTEISPTDYRRQCRALLPDTMTGAQFIELHGTHDDPATEIDPLQSYAIRGGVEHAIDEHARVTRFRHALSVAEIATQEGDMLARQRALRRAGQLMFASHASYSKRAQLGAPETDLLVRLIAQQGPGSGLLGAKITGGGSGGSVAVLIDTFPTIGDMGEQSTANQQQRVLDAVQPIVAGYEGAVRLTPHLITGSSPGAYDCPVRAFL